MLHDPGTSPDRSAARLASGAARAAEPYFGARRRSRFAARRAGGVEEPSAAVMQVEALAQLAGTIALQMEGVEPGSIFFFGGVDGVKWKKPVVPGDTLVMEVELTKFNKKFGLAKATGKAYVDGDLVVQVGEM